MQKLELSVARHVGQAIEESMNDAWKVWRSTHAAHLTSELAWANEVLKITTVVEQLKSARLRVVCTVQARRPWKSETYYYQYVYANNHMVVPESKS